MEGIIGEVYWNGGGFTIFLDKLKRFTIVWDQTGEIVQKNIADKNYVDNFIKGIKIEEETASKIVVPEAIKQEIKEASQPVVIKKEVGTVSGQRLGDLLQKHNKDMELLKKRQEEESKRLAEEKKYRKQQEGRHNIKNVAEAEEAVIGGVGDQPIPIKERDTEYRSDVSQYREYYCPSCDMYIDSPFNCPSCGRKPVLGTRSVIIDEEIGGESIA